MAARDNLLSNKQQSSIMPPNLTKEIAKQRSVVGMDVLAAFGSKSYELDAGPNSEVVLEDA